MKKMNWFVMACMLVFLTFGTGCVKPYNQPVYAEISTSETAFVIPLEGEGKDQQVRFDSEAYLAERKAAAKRVQIPMRWNQEGYIPNDGKYIPTIRVVKVDRTPVTRQWGVDRGKTVEHGNPLWLQSADNISFSIGFNCTAFIHETNAAKFLYYYRGDQLDKVIDSEIKARYQQSASHVCATLKMDDLKSHTLDIVHAIEADVVPFFALRGITITTIGQFGGIEYRDPKIMEAIEQTYVAQQEKVNAAAQLAAQGDKNKKIEMEAIAVAEASKTKAQGEAEGIYTKSSREADGKLKMAEAEAKGIREITKAMNEANSTDGILKLRALEVQKVMAEKWQGGVPSFQINGGGEGQHTPFPAIILDTRNNGTK